MQIENLGRNDVLERYDRKETFFYLDPPYVHSTRRAGGYDHEMTDCDHRNLVDTLKNLKGKVLLSGYANEIYDTLGWRRMDYNVVSHAAGRVRASGLQGVGTSKEKQKRVESLWLNYEVNQLKAERAVHQLELF